MMVGVVVDEFLTTTESKLTHKLENNQQLMRENQQRIISSENKIREKLDRIEKKLNGDLSNKIMDDKDEKK